MRLVGDILRIKKKDISNKQKYIIKVKNYFRNAKQIKAQITCAEENRKFTLHAWRLKRARPIFCNLL